MNSIACAYDALTTLRFESKVDRSGGPNACHLWTAGKDRVGYGKFWARGCSARAHRVAYSIAHGVVPPTTYVCHRCDTPACVNPEHLFAGTPLDNMRDKMAKGRLRVPFGYANGRAKLTRADVVEVRRLAGIGVFQYEIARRFGITQSGVSRIVTGDVRRRG